MAMQLLLRPSISKSIEGCPIQIIDFRMIPKRPSKLIIQKGLSEIISKVGDKPIHLISIAGASRQGKSFLLSILLNMLSQLEQGISNPWKKLLDMDHLEGFEFQHGIDRITVGFWMWSKPFILHRTDGTEIAVLLMDTQGVFDSNTTKRDWSMIVGLSLLTSSTLIYNVSQNILEDTLEIFHSFVEFGMLSFREDPEIQSPFQKLVFLIRDWNMPQEFPYGALGGRHFKDRMLKTNENMPDELQLIRTKLKTCFDEIECFLMPYPGEPTRLRDYKGNLNQLDDEFLHHMKVFSEDLLELSNLTPKMARGQNISANELLQYFEEFGRLFNGIHLPKPQTLFEVTIDTKLNNVVETLLKIFETDLQEKTSTKSFYTTLEFDKLFQVLHEKVLHNYNEQTITITLDKNKKRYLRNLTNELFGIYQNKIAANNELLKQFQQNTVEAACKAYQNFFTNELCVMAYLPEQYEEITKRAKLEAIKEVEKQCGKQDVTFYHNIQELLKNKLTVIETELKSKNEERLNEETTKIVQTIQDLTQDYDNFLTVACETGVLSKSKLEEVHEKSEEKVLQKLQQHLPSKNLMLVEKAKTELQKNILKVFEQRAKKVAELQLKLNAKVEEMVAKEVKEFKNTLEHVTEPYSSLSEIENLHRSQKAIYTDKLNSFYQIYPDVAKFFIDNAITLMDDHLNNLKEEFSNNQKIERDNLEVAIETASKDFEKKLAVKMEQADFDLKKHFGQLCSDLKSRALDSQKHIKWKTHQSVRTAFSDAVNMRIEKIAKQQKQKHQMLLNETRLELTANLNDLVDKVRNTLNAQVEENVIQDIESLEKKHKELVKTNFSDLKKNTLKGKLSDVEWNALVDGINSDLITTFEQSKNKLIKKLEKQRQHLIEAESKFLKCYDNGMNKECADLTDECKLPGIHQLHKEKAQTEIRKQMQKFSAEELQDFEQRVFSKMDQFFNSRKEKFQTVALEALNKKCCKTFIEKASSCKNTCKNEEDYKKDLEENMDEQMDYLEMHKPSSSKQQIDTVRSSLRKELRELINQYMEQYKTGTIQAKKFINDEIEAARLLYDDKIKAHLTVGNSKLYLDPKDLDIWLKKTKEDIITQKVVTNGEFHVDHLESFKKQMSEQLNQKSVLTTTENKEGFQAIKTTIDNKLQVMLSEFETNLETTSLKTCESVKENFTTQAKIVMKNAKISNAVQNKWLDDFILQLTEIIDKWKLDVPQESALELCIEKAKKDYHAIMKDLTLSNTHLETSELEKQHQRAVKHAMEKITLKRTRYISANVSAALKLACRQYRDVNDMRYAVANNIAIGIDLGTTYSCVAVYRQDGVEMIPNTNDHKNITPSYILFNNNEVVVGQAAKDEAVIYPDKAIFDAKRLIGRKFSDKVTQNDIKMWPFKVINHDGRPKIQVGSEKFFPEQVSAELLKRLRKDAEVFLNCTVENAVITVPAYFSDSQKTATKNAGAVAGLKILGLINEPTSAAIAYSLTYSDDNYRNVLVYDLGGGTFDVSVLSISQGDITVKAVGGDNHLGGEDFDNNMLNYCLDQFNLDNGIDLRHGESRLVVQNLRRIRHICERKKITLSVSSAVNVIAEAVCGNIDMKVEVTREKFCQLNDSLFKKTISIVEQALIEAKLTKNDIDDVVLVGGSTRIPKIQELLQQLFPGKHLNMKINPDEVVARGAAIYAAMQSGSQARELQKIKFTDVAPLSLGIEIKGGRFSRIIPKNSKVPVSNTQTYYTAYPNQDEVNVLVYEGEDPVARNNNLLGNFILRGIPPGPQGTESINITISCNKEGILDIRAVINSTGGKNSIKIESKRTNLTASELDALTSKTGSDNSKPKTYRRFPFKF